MKTDWYYLGVSFDRTTGRYNSRLGSHRLGRWLTPEKAAVARDRAILFLGYSKDLQLPRRSKRLGALSPEGLRREARLELKRDRFASQYLGVALNTAGTRWTATAGGRKNKVALGGFATDFEAAIAYDRLAKYLNGEAAVLNFPEKRYPPASVEELREERLNPSRGRSSARPSRKARRARRR